MDYIAFFDLDRTLTGKISGREIVVNAWEKGLMSGSYVFKAILLSLAHKLKLKDPLKIIDDMASWIKGLPKDTLTDLFSEVCRDSLLPSLFPQAAAEINKHKERKARTVLLSASLKPICREMAKYLGMDDVICSELEIVEGFYTGHYRGTYCYGKEKAVRLKKYCEENNSTPELSWYYGDSISDLPALSIAGNPVCVNPDKKLSRVARKNGWKVLNWG